jgi:hypothetical protein
MCSFRKLLFVGIFFFLNCYSYAQHTKSDSVKIWRSHSHECTLYIDSIRIIAGGEQDDHEVLEKRLHSTGDFLNRLAGQDIAKNIHNDPRIDSLNQRMSNLSAVSMFLSERFDYRLVQIDSCLGVKNDLDGKIYAVDHGK